MGLKKILIFKEIEIIKLKEVLRAHQIEVRL